MKRPATLSFALCLMSLVCIFPIPSAAAALPTGLTSIVAGVNVTEGALNDAKTQMIQEVGITWLRMDVVFHNDWGFQTNYAIARQHGLSFIGTLDYWTLANNNSFTLADWNRTVALAQATYPSITVWEIWNEPIYNRLGYFDGSPQHYLQMLSSAYAILKAGNPLCTVVGLGGANLGNSNDVNFARSLLALGAGAKMDALSIHAYAPDLNKGDTWEYYQGIWLKDLAIYKQFGKPIWVTETGLQAGQMTEADQALFMSEVYHFFQVQGAAALVWWCLIDYTSQGTQTTWGLLRSDMTERPVADILRSLAQMTPRRR